MVSRLRIGVVVMAATLSASFAHAEQPSFLAAPPLYYDLAHTPSDAARANIFLPREPKTVHVPPAILGKAVRFEARDDEAKVVASGAVKETADLDKTGTGWYRIDFFDGAGTDLGWTTAAILPPMPKHLREDSPVAVDVALSWVAPDSDTDRARMTEIAERAGGHWVRDRMRWREIETAPGEYAPGTKYDRTAKLQHRSGLDVLQVFHDMPKWVRPQAEEGQDRALPDLRAVRAFGKALAKRFHGSVQAWEPWNEANCGSFGAWPIHLMCAWQKAAYLGFKEGDHKTTVSWQPIAGINTPSLAKGVVLNGTWPYFDAYSIHSYDWNMGYMDLWKNARDAASGKPVWVTESDRGIHAPKDAVGGELDPQFALLKAQFIAQSYADSLAAGASRHFHFILGQYMETTVQFGLLRQDMTPRPAYSALAAVARALNGMHCIGSVSPSNAPGMRIVAFRGRKHDLAVEWIENSGEWEKRGAMCVETPSVGGGVMGKYTDYLGRTVDRPTTLTGRPLFVEMALGACDGWPLTPVPRGESRGGAPCPVVLQADLPRAELRAFKPEWTEESNYFLPPNSETPLTLWVYNFSDKPVSGTAPTIEVPEGWTCDAAGRAVDLAPGERAQFTCTLKTGSLLTEAAADSWVRLQCNFGNTGHPVAAFRVRLLKPDGEAQ